MERKEQVAADLTSDLLGIRDIRPAPDDSHVAMLRRDIARGRSQCVVHIIDVLYADGGDGIPLERLLRFPRLLSTYIEADFGTFKARGLPELQGHETEWSTNLDRIQMAVANGCRSSRTLDGGIEAIDQLLPLLEELRSAFVTEKRRQSKGRCP